MRKSEGEKGSEQKVKERREKRELLVKEGRIEREGED